MHRARAAAALHLSNPKSILLRCFQSISHNYTTTSSSFSSPFTTSKPPSQFSLPSPLPKSFAPQIFSLFSTKTPPQTSETENRDSDDSDVEEEWMAEWEEEDDGAEPTLGDGGDGGGVVLSDVGWGQMALSVAREILSKNFDEDFVMYAFKVSPKGYIYVRLDKLTNKYGCPDIEEIQSFNRLYKQQLDHIIESGEIPIDLAVEVSSPGAERLLRVPEDLDRFKDMAMKVEYVEELESKIHHKKNAVLMVVSVDIENSQCVWKLADVKENRDPAGKGRPLNRKQRDMRFQLPFEVIKKVNLYLN